MGRRERERDDGREGAITVCVYVWMDIGIERKKEKD